MKCLILLRRKKIVEILRTTNFSIQVDDSTIHNQVILLVYVRFNHEDDIREEMLFIKSFFETTNGEDIFNEVMQYFNDKNIPSTNLINTASYGAAAMTGKVKGFVSRMKSVAPHILNICCIIHRQHVVAKNIGGHMENALNTSIHTNNIVKSNSVNNRFFMQFCEDEDFKTLLLHTEFCMMAGRVYYSFHSVTGTAPDIQTVKWSDMKTGSYPHAYIDGTNLIGEIVINGSKEYYRLDLSKEIEQGYQPSVTLNKRKKKITIKYRKKKPQYFKRFCLLLKPIWSKTTEDKETR
ncbi:Hypothetical predicted protein [Octopus vulgaris]|uniref:Uncharacterized protein n=1 Tax=Octopus vulgaris TaxID=6645 RepID=A0AA36BM33_OCTVU|nr:Hypothetical predicted protein [Octopus vulgaris]